MPIPGSMHFALWLLTHDPFRHDDTPQVFVLTSVLTLRVPVLYLPPLFFLAQQFRHHYHHRNTFILFTPYLHHHSRNDGHQ
jgi:hypothetical protein